MYEPQKVVASCNFKDKAYGTHPTVCKVVVQDKLKAFVNKFSFLGCDIYSSYVDVNAKIEKLSRMCGTIKGTFRNKVRKELAVPAGSETWTLISKDKSRI